jgi:hypothetical protein
MIKTTKILLPLLIIISTFFSCKKDDPTPPPITYSKVAITKVTLLGISNSNNGVNWDNVLAGYYPDVYFEITQAGTTTSIFELPTAQRHENIQNSDLPKSWAFSSPYLVITNLTSSIDVDLYDFDSLSAAEFMGTTTFSFANYTTGPSKYPASATVTSGSYIVKLDFIWSN